MAIEDLFIDVLAHSWLMVDDLIIAEPKRDLLLRRFHSIRTVDDVATDINAVIT